MDRYDQDTSRMRTGYDLYRLVPTPPTYATYCLRTSPAYRDRYASSNRVHCLRKARFVGLAKVRAQTTFTFAAYNLTRMATIFGWRLSAVVG